MISLSTGWPAPRLYPIEELAKIAAACSEEGGNALNYLTAEGLYPLREQIAVGEVALRDRAGGDHRDLGRAPGDRLVCRALLEPGDVAVVESPTFVGLLSSLRETGARVIGVPYDKDGLDLDALEHVLARHEVKLVRAPDRARTRPAATSRRRAASASPRWPSSATSSCSRTASTRTCASRARPAAAARAGARPRDLLRLAVEDGRRRPADGLDRGARPGVRPAARC